MKVVSIALCAMLPVAALAESPALQTPAPVLYLADNLDEPDALGYCLDTVGRGLSDRAHLHSCKPRGGDVQFMHDDQGQIKSATLDDLCLDVSEGSALTRCAGGAGQVFTWSDTAELRLAADPDLCLASAPESRRAGPFVARDLVLASCETIPIDLKTWVHLSE
ncbi:hypothetical protein [Cognatishimia sp.]|uniref:hypothetical protein n=1 Tax=Cognatishimia sp. TaxID=2211648 RepID=UPI00351199C4|nr:RICIN domain-containing protein [Cognatishimia sp.]